MKVYDVKRERKDFYAPKNTAWAIVDVPEQQFIAVDGAGNPNTAPAYASAVQALYVVAYTLKFAVKRSATGDHEGRSAQVLHIGSYDDEAPVLHELHHTYLAAQGLRPSGLHHEVYLSDPRKTAPEKLKTVLRQPVEDLAG
ncbi:GyrI-like domain-containing protein [Actinacidiphila bryophytorum]|uniref:GyrI-like domain-containing protein n=1 Tax=Actinacidiphila bryophytorum TaxID=1436133 RepID=A0A9W4H2C2_9ACTN|nr:GyrI-like domain-containing protein [Actinacidiphila bryophytorum]MBM9440177.1 GyrI-like domain-containing protein [Actinacidiphila bryophytorum]MBN6541837.1 GyrI-like domain-containing protein [Actinacidiphila bryophytorum]CAG7645067.1 GyrI-like domain-containing protein [Actinacidiphila bryophytorum]